MFVYSLSAKDKTRYQMKGSNKKNQTPTKIICSRSQIKPIENSSMSKFFNEVRQNLIMNQLPETQHNTDWFLVGAQIL